MTGRYDRRTTTFSPEGRLFQVEYAIENIKKAPAALGIVTAEGVVLAGEVQELHKMLKREKDTGKVIKIDDHIYAAIAGLSSDAKVLTSSARATAQQYLYRMNERCPVESVVEHVAHEEQVYTQSGGLRPFGVSLLFAGWDACYGFQLYHIDPSGNYCGWKATAIGMNSEANEAFLKKSYKDDMKIEEGVEMAVEILLRANKTKELKSENMEVYTVTRPEDKVLFTRTADDEVQALILKLKEKVHEPEVGVAPTTATMEEEKTESKSE